MVADMEEFWWMFHGDGVSSIDLLFLQGNFGGRVRSFLARLAIHLPVFGLVYSDPPSGFAVRRLGLDGEATGVRRINGTPWACFLWAP